MAGKPKVEIRVDLREFTQALQLYVEESRLEVADAVNKKAGDVAIMAAKRAKKAQKGAFPPLSSGIYNALAAADSNKYGGSFGDGAFVAQEKLKKRFGGRVVKGQGNAKAAKYLYNRRAGAIGYSKSIFLRLATQIGKAVRGVKVGKRVGALKSKHGEITQAKPAELTKWNDKPFATLEIFGIDKDHAKQEIEPALQGGVDDAVKDMRVYLNKKMRERARARSGRGRKK